ncbi:MAG: hypothetical protein IPJ17_01230 [Holophagales bacterium]|nr:MAG: hypothetical protein IPJ17_01230 [Holophagales bacterium]
MAGILRAVTRGPLPDERRVARGLLGALLLLWLALTLPLALGDRTLFLRDVFATGLPAKAFGAAELAAGRIPAVDPAWALGQVYRGDPNTLSFYPDNLLYLVLPFWSAFNLHFALHWLLGFFAMRRLARELGQPPLAALLAGVTWAACGYGLSALSFYNLVVVAAWWPFALAGVARGGRRGWSFAALALGLALLGGEPVTAALGLVPLLLVAVERHGWRTGLVGAAGTFAGALAVAAPQLVATLRVVGFSTRAFWGAGEAAGRFALHPVRLLELLLPLPFGWPTRYGPFDYWSFDWFPVVPFVFSLHVGVVGGLLAIAAARRASWWSWLAVAGLGFAWLGGVAPGLLGAVSAGLFRYPEKFLFWFFLAACVLAGQGLSAWESWAAAARHRLVAGAALLAVGGVALLLLAAPAAEVVVRWAGSAIGGPAAGVQIRLAALGLVAAGLLVGAATVARRSAAALVGLQLLGLFQLAPLWATDATEPYREGPAWRALLPAGAAVARFEALERLPAGDEAPADAAARARLDLADLAAAPGALFGMTYPLAPDLVGLQSPLSAHLELELRRLDWRERVVWLRRLGADALVVRGDEQVPLPRTASRRHGGFTTSLYAVPDASATRARQPRAWWPERVDVEPDLGRAVRRLAAVEDPRQLSLVPRALAHAPGGRVALVAESSDRLELEIDGGGGLVVIRRAYLPLYRATLENGARVPTGPVDVALLGIEVPPGKHRLVVDVSAAAERAAGWVAGFAVLALVALGVAPIR